MGVITKADEHYDAALTHIYDALIDLNDIVIRECDGHEDFSTELKQKMLDACNTLVALRISLSPGRY